MPGLYDKSAHLRLGEWFAAVVLPPNCLTGGTKIGVCPVPVRKCNSVSRLTLAMLKSTNLRKYGATATEGNFWRGASVARPRQLIVSNEVSS